MSPINQGLGRPGGETGGRYPQPEQIPKSASGPDAAPTAEQLQFYRDMTQEEWRATIADNERQINAAGTHGNQDREQIEQSAREKWERRIRALEAVQATGNPAQDARGFFEAIGLDPSTLGPYAQAYKDGDSKMMLRYFKEVQSKAHDLPPTLSEGIRQYFRVFDQTVTRIVDAAESAGVKE